MRELILMRHAHAQDERSAVDDASRRLDARGRTEAAAAAQRLRTLGLLPDAILASSAARARETAHIVARELGLEERRISTDLRLYHAPPGVILQAVRGYPADVQRLLLVGHNPGLTALAQRCCADPHIVLGTAALCLLTAPDDSWAQWQPQPDCGRLLT